MCHWNWLRLLQSSQRHSTDADFFSKMENSILNIIQTIRSNRKRPGTKTIHKELQRYGHSCSISNVPETVKVMEQTGLIENKPTPKGEESFYILCSQSTSTPHHRMQKKRTATRFSALMNAQTMFCNWLEQDWYRPLSEQRVKLITHRQKLSQTRHMT